MDFSMFFNTPSEQLAQQMMMAHPDVDPSAALHALNSAGGLGGGKQVGAAPPPNPGFGVAGEGQTTGPDATLAANTATPGMPPNLPAMIGLAGAASAQQKPLPVAPVHTPGGHPAQFINPQTAASPANVGPVRKRSASLGELLGSLR